MARRAVAVSFAVLVLAAFWIAWTRWSAAPPIAPGACGGCNILLITIDTLRRDRVGAFGGPAGLTPTLDALAEHGLRLTRAYSSAPLTLPSHTSILTSLSPPAHGVRANGLFRLGPDVPTLATVLKGHGYRTGAFVGAFVLDARFGLTRGFDVYDDRYGEQHAGDGTEGAERRAEEVIKPAAAWILQPQAASSNARGAPPSPRRWGPTPSAPGSGLPLADASHASRETRSRAGMAAGAPPAATAEPPWFAWIHLYDPHEPYRAPEPYASQHEPYDAEVAYTDAMVGKLLADLTAAGQLEHTAIIVAADHGESLGEHGEPTHGVFAYDVTLRVPWLVWAGSRKAGRSFDAPTRLIDLAPTALDLVGVPRPQTFEGRSVIHAVNAHEPAGPPAYFEAMDASLTRNWAPLTGIVSGGYKLIDLPIPELYDLASDPGETTNLFSRESERARTLTGLLRNTMAEIAARAAKAAAVTLNAESRQRLQALGYIGSSGGPRQRVYTDADDPKNLIDVSNTLNRAVSAFNGGERQAAMAEVRTIMAQHPGFTTAFGMYASMQRRTGDLAGAIATLEDIVRRDIADERVLVELAGYLEEEGQHGKAAGVLEAVIASHPDFAEAYNSLGAVYSAMGRHAQAQAAYRRVLELDPTSATAYENLGVDELRAGDRASAVADLLRALDLDPRLAAAHNTLATAYMILKKPDEAIAHWRTALELNPRLYDALFNLGLVLSGSGRREEARPYLQRFVDEAPPSRYGPDIAKLRALLAK